MSEIMRYGMAKRDLKKGLKLASRELSDQEIRSIVEEFLEEGKG